jgi:hypothetical protein
VIPPDIAAFLESGPSILVGTCSAARAPACGFGIGVRVDAGGGRIRVYLPASASAALVADLRATGEIAVTVSRPRDHRTFQLKGAVVAIADGDEADRAAIDRHLSQWAEELAMVGTPRQLTARVRAWPCHAVDVAVREIYSQTPGPGAGAPLA